MYETIMKLDYKNVIKYFCEISKVPRGSGNNQGISDFLVAFAKEHGLRYIQDESLNVIIFKDATPGFENASPVILQGHMDMVCVTDGTPHDFEKEGLDLFMDGEDLLAARGTTLGGDDGIAVAYGMALLADDTIEHPALEIVITTDEETGLYGAKALDCSNLKGKYMINCDSEDEGIVLISCAGGLRADGSFEMKTVEAEGTKIRVELSGLKGGHSGQEINNGRTNASILLGRMLFEMKNDWLLLNIQGGDKDNAIPAMASFEILVQNCDADAAYEDIMELASSYKKELEAGEPDITFSVTKGESVKTTAIHPVTAEKILFTLVSAMNGVQTMSHSIEGLVESSLNLGVFDVDTEHSHFGYSLRSSVANYKKFMAEKLKYMFEYQGGECEFKAEYPAWEYKKESKLRDLFAKVFKEEYGYDCKMEAIHAGLECGIIGEKMPGIDMVSIGPDMQEIHSPRERLSVSSSVRVYKFLEKLLAQMKEY